MFNIFHGTEADDILNSLDLTADNRKKIKNVKEAFNNYFIVRRNVIYERAKFNLRIQKDSESVESYITDLHALSEHCKYGALREEMIRDRIVVGIRDSRLSEKLQLDAELTLKKAADTVRQSEAVKRQQAELKPDASCEVKDVDAVKKRGFKSKNSVFKKEQKPEKVVSRPNNQCGRCGKMKHSRDSCPARDAGCKTCKRKGHYAVVCWSKPLTCERFSGQF